MQVLGPLRRVKRESWNNDVPFTQARGEPQRLPHVVEAQRTLGGGGGTATRLSERVC